MNSKIISSENSIMKTLKELGAAIPLSIDGQSYALFIPSIPKLATKKINLDEVFKNDLSHKRGARGRRGHLMNLDIIRQIKLPLELVKKYSILDGRIGLPGLKASREIHKLLSKKSVQHKLDMRWHYTGEIGNGLNEEQYQKVFVSPAELSSQVSKSNFLLFHFDNGNFSIVPPETRYHNGVALYLVRI